MKNPIQQNVVSVILGLLFSFFCVTLFKIDVIISLLFGAGVYLAFMFIFSRSKKQMEEDFQSLELSEDMSVIKKKINEMKEFSRILDQKLENKTQADQILHITQFAHSIITGLNEHGMDICKLKELRSYLEDFSLAIQGYIDILHNDITISDPIKRRESIKFFEDLLPTFENGFQKLAENVDQSAALLATMKAQLLKNKMLSHGRIDS